MNVVRRRDEETLRAAFAELGGAEEAAAPPLRRLLARGPQGGTRTRGGGWWLVPPAAAARWAAALAVFTAAGLGLWLGHAGGRHRPETAGGEKGALSHWVAPTDFLLDTPGIELLRSTPEIPGPLPLDLESNATHATTGDPR